MSDEDGADGPKGPKDKAEPEESPASDDQAPAAVEPAPSGLAAALEAPPVAGAVEAYHQRARLAEDRLAEVLEAYRTLRKETEAYRERFTRNIERRYDQRRERLLVKFIDILDNLDRALEAAETTDAGHSLIEGLILVRTQLLQTLQDEGLERIPVLGFPYDPHVSEAVATQPVEDPEHHHVVVKEMLRGYRLNGRIARASRVVIGEYPQTKKEPVAAAPSEPAEPEPPSRETKTEEDGPSLDEIIARAEAQEALFPDAFEDRPRRDEDGED